jgi:rhodanese-related sulfurtransferase
MKLRRTPVAILLTLLVLVLAVYGWPRIRTASAASTSQGLPVLSKNAFGFMDLRVEQLAGSMLSKNFTLVNVHVPDQGSLPNTDVSIPFDQIKSSLDKLPGKDAPIVVYCRSGGMSVQVAATLAAAGYTKIYELKGGFNAWKAAGHDLLNK